MNVGARAGERVVDGADGFALRAVEADALEREAAAVEPGFVDEVIKPLTIGRDRRPGDAGLVGERGEPAAVDEIAEEVAVFGVVLVAAVRVA